MCRLYNCDGDPSFVRLCYKTRLAGERIPWSEAQHYVTDHYSEFGGCVFIEALKRDRRLSGLSEDGLTLKLEIRLDGEYSTILREVLRWQFEGTRYCVENVQRTPAILRLDRNQPWLDLREVLARAATFGWKPHVAEETNRAEAVRI